jgi:formylglycine-generating enzyme required for sulfatase activity
VRLHTHARSGLPTRGRRPGFGAAVVGLAALALWLGCGGPPRSGGAFTAGQVRRDGAGVEQVWVPPGSFLMGSDDATLRELRALHPPAWVAGELPSERPQHRVRLTTGYWIDRFEVTNAAFQAFVAARGYERPELWSEGGRRWLQEQDRTLLPVSCVEPVGDHPRVCVTWFEAEAYAAWRGGRLPTEAQWEYAARGPESRRYPWGDVFDPRRCNVVDSRGPEPVGSHPDGASWVGAQDMAGNAMEWVQDWLDPTYYRRGEMENPAGPADGRVKVEKGGWWGSNPVVARSAYRHFEDPPTYGDKHIGFRIVSP